MPTPRLAGLHRTATLLLLTTSALFACSPPLTPTPLCQSTDDVQREVLAPSCGGSGCHSAATPSSNLDLVSPGLEARLVNAPSNDCAGQTLVLPGDPEGSWIYRKVVDPLPRCGARMPLAAPPLSEQQIACVRSWITALPPSDAGPPARMDAAVDAPDAPAAPDAPSCPAGQAECGGACVDTRSSNEHCGACGRACSGGQACMAGTCACAGGLTACGASCVDTASSAMNCGMCGNACPTGTVCSGGMCIRGGCPAGTTDCAGSCVNLQTSATNCGACGRACPAGASCAAGACGCGAGAMLCGGSCVNTATDARNCGACGRACPAGTACSGGVCTCAGGLALCGTACVDTQTSNANCGRCGNACAAGTTCSAGACASCGPAVSFAGQIQPIFTATCLAAACHNTGPRPGGGLTLASASTSYSQLVNARSGCPDGRLRVTPGSVANSYLINKLTGVGMCGGNQMPSGGARPLSSAQMDLIRAWICNGAMNN